MREHPESVDELWREVEWSSQRPEVTSLMATLLRNVGVLERSLRAGADPSMAFICHWAKAIGFGGNDHSIVELLLHHGADIDMTGRDEDGGGDPVTMLTLAAQRGHLAIVRTSLTFGASPNATPSTKCRPIVRAAAEGQVAVVELLARAGADLTAADEKGWSPLHRASIGGLPGVILALIRAGADPSAGDDDGDTPLHVAREGCVVDALVRGGADVEARNLTGVTPIAEAAGRGRSKVVAALVRAGADVEACGGDGEAPIHRAVGCGSANAETIRVLVDGGAEVDVLDSEGRTALLIAAWIDRVDLVDLLLELGADAFTALSGAASGDFTVRDGETALMRAAAADGVCAVTLILRAGVDDVNAVSANGRTALDLAAHSGRCWSRLIAAGALSGRC
jgi:ankyrin repeat protein